MGVIPEGRGRGRVTLAAFIACVPERDREDAVVVVQLTVSKRTTLKHAPARIRRKLSV